MSSLKPCKACGQMVSNDATTCPHCGKQIQEPQFVRALAAVWAACGLFAIYNAVTAGKAADLGPTADVVAIGAIVLIFFGPITWLLIRGNR